MSPIQSLVLRRFAIHRREMNAFHKLFNQSLDRLIQSKVLIPHKFPSAFQIYGYTEQMLAILLVMTVVTYMNLSLWVVIGIIGIVMLMFLGLAIIAKIIIGEKQLIYNHHEIAIMIMVVIFLKMLNQPILPYLDVTILGIGTLLVCGRLGCLMVGCCHGRSYKWGVSYRKEHVDVGFTPYYVGIRLFRIQAVESLWVLAVVLIGILFVLGGRSLGQALAWYIITYSIGRFCFEFIRSDPDRPYCWGFSKVQWTSIILMCAVVWAGLTGKFIYHTWHAVTTAGIVLTIIAVALIRQFRGSLKYRFFLPRHVREIAEAVQQVSHSSAGSEGRAFTKINTNPQNIPVTCISLGIRISTQKMENDSGKIRRFAISSLKEMITDRTATKLADLILKLKYPSHSWELIKGNQGIFHLLIRPLRAGGGK